MPKHVDIFSIQPLTSALASARQRKGLSQRALGAQVGLPQSHISKIESAGVDLQTTSLMELARALDLELMLIPRALIPAVQSLQQPASNAAQTPAYRLDDDGEVS